MIRVAEQSEAEATASRSKRGIMDEAPRIGNVYGLTLEQISIRPGWNSREYDFSPEDPEDIWLAESIRDSGVLEPITVIKEGDHVFVTNGHRRHAAATYARDVLGAKVERVPCRLAPRGSSALDQLFHQKDLNGGKGYSPFENGNLCKKGLALGATIDEVARRMHMSKGYVLNLIDLQAAPKEVTDLVRQDVVATTLAMQVMREEKGDGAAVAERLTEAVEIARAKGKTRATRKDLKAKPKPPKVEILSVPKDHPTYKAGWDDGIVQGRAEGKAEWFRRAAAIARQGGHDDAAALIEMEIAG